MLEMNLGRAGIDCGVLLVVHLEVEMTKE